MTRSRLIILAIMLAIFIVALPRLFAGGADPVTICHHPPGNPSNAQTITVDRSAVPAHLDHGDAVGACSPSPSQ